MKTIYKILLMVLVTIDVIAQTNYPKQYQLPETGGNIQWINLGKYTAAQSGQSIKITIIGHFGYNANNAQDFQTNIFFKTSNGSSVDANGFGGNSQYYSTGPAAAGFYEAKWVSNTAGVAATTYDLYVKIGTFTGGSTYTVENSFGTWTHIGELKGQVDPGIPSSTLCKATEQLIIGSPTSKLEVNGDFKITTANIAGFIFKRNGVYSSFYMGGSGTGGGIGTSNIGIGDFSMVSTSGAGNTVLGNYAGRQLQAGGGNSLIGYSSGTNIKGGSYNVGLGYAALSDARNGSRNIAIGYYAGRYLGGRDSIDVIGNNIALGWESMLGNGSNGSLNLGTYNIGLGYRSLFKNESGHHNIALGANSLVNNENGVHNISLGNLSMSTARNQNHNIAIGYSAMRYANDTTVSKTPFNIAIGYASLQGNTLSALNTGTLNTAIGAYALCQTTIGSNNTALSYQAMYRNTTGSHNVAIGHSSGLNSNSAFNVYVGMNAGLGNQNNLNNGGYNVGIGQGALINVQGIGQQNTAVGQWAGADITTGMQNTVVGRNTGRGVKTGNGNTIIGYGITGLDSTMNNRLILATGNGTKLVALENGNVGIGTTSPQNKLDVRGDIQIGQNGFLKIIDTGGNNGRLMFQNIGAIDFVSDFRFRNSTGTIEFLKINNTGQVIIGIPTTNVPIDYKLAVAGNIIAEKVKVKKSNTWPDYVFLPTYELLTLTEVEKFVKQNRHLPEIPSAAEIEKDGQDLGEMNRLLLKKVEELTLYLIELQKENQQQNIEIEKLKKIKK